jgi:hypothetical protein
MYVTDCSATIFDLSPWMFGTLVPITTGDLPIDFHQNMEYYVCNRITQILVLAIAIYLSGFIAFSDHESLLPLWNYF